MEEVLIFARDYINHPANRTKERKAKIRDTIRRLTGERLGDSCGTCYIEALFKIINLTKMTSRYELKKGVVLQAFGDASKTCTNNTLTDELAEWYLKNYPEKRIYFARVPDNAPTSVAPQIRIIPPTNIVPPEKIVIPEVLKETVSSLTEVPKKVTRKTKK
jgi:hypothetical protein